MLVVHLYHDCCLLFTICFKCVLTLYPWFFIYYAFQSIVIFYFIFEVFFTVINCNLATCPVCPSGANFFCYLIQIIFTFIYFVYLLSLIIY